jgi:uncharacterized protein (TIGR02246 family)
MRYVIVLILSLVLSMDSIGQMPDSAGIHQVLVDFVSAWNNHDANAFSMVFAEDADFTNIRGMGAHGRTNIDSFHAPVFRTLFKNSHQKITNSKIRFNRRGCGSRRCLVGNDRVHESGGTTCSASERVIEFRYDQEWGKMGDYRHAQHGIGGGAIVLWIR